MGNPKGRGFVFSSVPLPCLRQGLNYVAQTGLELAILLQPLKC